MTVTTLAYTGATQSYTVPAGVTFVTLECWGGAGCGGFGGLGGYSKGKLVVAPGTVLNVNVGGTSTTASPGWNGGGAGAAGFTQDGGGGGGASDVRLGGTALSNRVIVAGGGGGVGAGGSSAGHGGTGGGAVGGAGGNGVGGGYGNSGGTQSAGYALGQGGVATYGGNYGGGGGGGGYWGGRGATGSGVAGGGGGGGSGYLSSSLTGTISQTGVRTGAGQVVITAINTAPLAPDKTSPSGNGYIINTEANTFTWAFVDTDPGDAQSAASFRYKKFGDTSWTTLTNIATTVASYTLAASTWTAGFQYEWQVTTSDKAGAASPWSASAFTNTIAVVPAPTITTPTSGDMEYNTPVELDWTLPSGFPQTSYDVRRTENADGSGVLYYYKVVASTATAALVPLDASPGRTDWILVRFYYKGHWSAFAAVDILNEFGPPHTPLLVLAQVPDRPEVVVSITNPPASLGYTDTVSNDLYRDGVRIATGLPANGSFTDLLPGAGLVDYTVVAFAASGATATSY